MATVIVIDQLDFVEADACLVREVQAQAEATQWPIESGASISDHVILQPLRQSLELVFAAQPVREIHSATPGEQRPWRAYEMLRSALLNRKPIEVISPDETMQDLVLTQVNSPKIGGDGSSRRVTVEVQQVARVSASESELPRKISRLKHAGKAAKGTLSAVVATTAQENAAKMSFAGGQSLIATPAIATRVNGALAQRTGVEVSRLVGLPEELVVTVASE